MDFDIHGIFPASLADSFHSQLQFLADNEIVSRFWARDMSLWPAETGESRSSPRNLDWLDLPSHLPGLLTRISACFDPENLAPLDDVVFMGVHSASLAAELIASLPLMPERKVSLLNSVDPAAIRAVEHTLDLQRTLFVVASKQGSSLRACLLLLHFLKRLKDAGVPSPGSHFVAFTESNSYMAELAKEYSFRAVFVDPPGILTQFSGLIHYNSLLSALSLYTPDTLAASAQRTAQQCSTDFPPGQNPALLLSALLSAVAQRSGRLLLFSSPNLAPFADRIGHVVGSALCRNGRGIPALWIHGPAPHLNSPGDLAVFVDLATHPSLELAARREERRNAGLPMLSISLPDISELAAEIFCWEIAACFTASRIDVNPFDDSDLTSLRAYVHAELDIASEANRPQSFSPRCSDSFLDLYFEGATRRELSTLSLEGALQSFLRIIPVDGYFALLNFLPAVPELNQQLKSIQADLQATLAIPIALAGDSRFLNRAGQTLLGGPKTGAVLLITGDSDFDTPVFGSPYTFGRLNVAYSSAIFDALVQRKRHIVRAHLRGSLPKGLDALYTALRRAAQAGSGNASRVSAS